MNNSDVASEIFEYPKAVYNSKSLIPDIWYNSNELLIRRNIYTALPIYALTKNLFLTYKINSIITNLLLIFSFSFLLIKVNIQKNYLPLGLTLFLGLYSYNLSQDQLLFFFMQAYALYAIVIFLTLGSLAQEKFTLLKILCCILALYMGITGPKMFLLLYIPLILTMLLFYGNKCMKCNLNLNNEYLKPFLYTLFLVILNVIGILIYLIFFKKYTSTEYYSLSFKPLAQVLQGSYKQITSLLESIDIRNNGSMFSPATLNEIIKIFFIILYLVAGKYLWKNGLGKTGKLILSTLGMSVLISMFAMIMADFDISVRFYFIMPIFMTLLLTLFFSTIATSNWYKLRHIIGFFLLSGVALNVATYYRPLLNGFMERDYENKQEVAEYLLGNHFDTVLGSRWNANTLNGFVNGHLNTGVISYDTFKPFKFLTSTCAYTNARTAIVLSDTEINNINDNQYLSWKFLQTGRLKRKVGDLNIYFFMENPVKTFEMPKNPSEKAIYNFVSGYCDIMNGVMNLEDNSIISNNTEGGIIVRGPGIDIENGIYSFYLYYEAESMSKYAGELSIVSNNGGNILDSQKIFSNENYIKIPDIKFSSNENVEFIIENYDNSQIILKELVIIKDE